MTKKLQENIKSSFLENLKQAVESGDASKGVESINKINEIHKLASTMDGETAEVNFDKRVEDAGLKDVIQPEERKIMSVESERQKIKIEKEEEKLKMIANIENSESGIISVKKELVEITKQYYDIIFLQEEELNILKIRYEAKYDEKYGEEKEEN